MRLDSLPVAEMATFAYEDKPEETVELYNLGYPVGSKLEKSKEGTEEDKWVLNNHCKELESDAWHPYFSCISNAWHPYFLDFSCISPRTMRLLLSHVHVML
jgi:hypothetical protein